MKWKRSKKAHQEAKSSKEGDSNKTQTSSCNSYNKTSVPVSSPESSERPHTPLDSNQEVRKLQQENESLYRPYVV